MPVLGLGTRGGGRGGHPHLAAFPAEALGAAVEAAQQVLGSNTAVVCWARTAPGPAVDPTGSQSRGRSTDVATLFSPAETASEWLTFTGLSVAEKASCRAQQASLHISSVNTGPAVTRTYLPGGTVLHSDILLSQKAGPAQ